MKEAGEEDEREGDEEKNGQDETKKLKIKQKRK
jgi:hypothetical protein